MYTLNSDFTQGHFTVLIVGCGGTGGFVAEGLYRLLPARATLMLVDPDLVEERNLGRQNFSLPDLGRFKSQVLAETLALKMGRAVAYSVLPISMLDSHGSGIVIGCVDNGPARRDIAQKIVANSWHPWWLDAGNGENYGQVLIGNRETQRLHDAFELDKGLCHFLPLPTIQRPELLSQVTERRGCAEAVEAREQSPTINRFMAALVLEMIRKLIDGKLTWWQVFIDLEAGSFQTVSPTPEAVSKLTGVPLKKLVKR